MSYSDLRRSNIKQSKEMHDSELYTMKFMIRAQKPLTKK